MQFLVHTRIPFVYINVIWLLEVRPRARMENLPSLYSRAHVRFCKRCYPVAEKEVSAIRFLIGLQEPANVLRS